MGRTVKIVLDEDGRDRRQTGYYSTPTFIVEYLAEEIFKLSPNAVSVFDPCVGKGELIEPYLMRGLKVRGFDIHDYPRNKAVNFLRQNFISDFAVKEGSLFAKSIPEDVIVLNPPYNCHEHDYIRNNKALLRAAFDVGTHNMYSMFLSAVIQSAKPGAIIGVVIADSFLTARHHELLRKQVIENCKIHLIFLCPTNLFRDQGADVRTCIVILEKMIRRQGDELTKTMQRPSTVSEFKKKLQKGEYETKGLEQILLSSELDRREIVIGAPEKILSLFNLPRIGSLFKCVTGISTGNDEKYLSKVPREGFNTPFYKNPASKKFFCPIQYYIDDNYQTLGSVDKKFTLRNRGLVGMEGITCSSMGVAFSACFLPKASTFGVNPNIFAGKDTWWLISYLNSSLVLYLLRGILNRTNMTTSGYVSRLPIPSFSISTKNQLADLALFEHKVRGSTTPCTIQKIDALVFEAVGLSESDINYVKSFAKSVYKKS